MAVAHRPISPAVMLESFLKRFGYEKRASLENPKYTLHDPEIWDALGHQPTFTGVAVTPESAMRLSAVHACVRVLAESVGALSLITYRRTGRGRERASDHYLYPILHDSPNPEIGAYKFWETATAHLSLWGSFYAETVRDNGNRVRELWPLHPQRVAIERQNGRKVYRVAVGSEQVILPASDVFHVPGFGWDGDRGLSPIALARQSIGLGLAAEEYAARLYSNGVMPGSKLEHPGKLSNDAHERLRKSIEAQAGGLSKSHRLLILEEGMRWHESGISPEDQQLLESRKFSVDEICRIFRVPPVLVGHNNVTTWGSGIEQLMIGFVQHSLRPILVRFEREISRSLLSDVDRQIYYAEFLVESMLRGDSQARAAFYRELWQLGAISSNEIAEREGLEAVEGGDTRYVPLNYTPLIAAPQARPATRTVRDDIERRSADSRATIQRGFVDAFRSRAQRYIGKETAWLRKQDPRSETFSADLEAFYEQHAGAIAKQMLPVLMSLSAAAYREAATEVNASPELDDDATEFIKAYAETFGQREAIRSRQAIERLVENTPPDQLPAAIEETLDDWDESRAESVAEYETVRAGQAISKLAYTLAGVTLFRWRANADACPLCDSLDGRVVGSERAFLAEGDTVEAEGANPLTVSSNITHPPLHRGCSCSVVPESA